MNKAILFLIISFYGHISFAQNVVPESEVIAHFFKDTTVQRIFHFDRFDSMKIVDCNYFIDDHALDSLSKPHYKVLRSTDLSLLIMGLRGERFILEQKKWGNTVWLKYAYKCGSMYKICIYLGQWNMHGVITYKRKKGKLVRVKMDYGFF